MFSISRRLKKLVCFLLFLVFIVYIKFLSESLVSDLWNKDERVDTRNAVRNFKDPVLSTSPEYILIVKKSQKYKSAAESLISSLKLSVKTKLLSDSFQLRKPLPYLVIFDENTIIEFGKEAQFRNYKTVITENSLPVVALCYNLDICNDSIARALLPSIAYYKSYLKTTNHNLFQILKKNKLYYDSESSQRDTNFYGNSLLFLLEGDVPSPPLSSFSASVRTDNIVPLLEVPLNNIDTSKLPKTTAQRLKQKYAKTISAYYDFGQADLISKVVIGNNLSDDWFYKVFFLDVVNFLTRRQLSFGLNRLVQVDIDDVLIPSKLRENALTKADVDAMVEFQRQVRSKYVPNFTFKLGFCGDFYRRGRHPEEIEAYKYLMTEKKNEFSWFPHLFRHYQPHNLTFSKLREEMVENRKFAIKNSIPVDGSTVSSYAVSSHHSGVYPIHNDLYQLWKDIWNISVTSTEQYPHLHANYGRKGFIYSDISVLPRQLVGLFTRTLRFAHYPNGGLQGLQQNVRGGEVFMSLLLNPVAVFMTHVGNYGSDRLGLHLFGQLFEFVHENTNFKLISTTPNKMANYHFTIFPEQVMPQWTNPCDDGQHMEIVPKGYKCDSLPQIIIVGPQRAGTAAFQLFLSAHPDFSTSFFSTKAYEEVQFFDNDGYYQKGVDWYKSQFPIMSKDNQINFEKSASYFDKYKVPHRIKSLLPSVKLVMILRNPIDRAYSWFVKEWSHFNLMLKQAEATPSKTTGKQAPHLSAHQTQSQLTSKMSFSQLIRFNSSTTSAVDGRINSLSFPSDMNLNWNQSKIVLDFKSKILTPGFYYKHIKRWLDTFTSLKSFYFVDGDQFALSPAEELNKFVQWFTKTPPPVPLSSRSRKTEDSSAPRRRHQTSLNFSTILEFNEKKGLFCLSKSIASSKSCLGSSKGKSFEKSPPQQQENAQIAPNSDSSLLPKMMSEDDRKFLMNYYMSDMLNLRSFFAKQNITSPKWLITITDQFSQNTDEMNSVHNTEDDEEDRLKVENTEKTLV